MMKAARFHAARDIRVEDVPVPDVGAGTVLVDVEWCGICGTDLHEYLVGPFMVPRKERPHRLTREHSPVTMGHEFCGRVSRLPHGYTGTLKIGQPVMVDPRIVCRSCDICTGISNNFCKDLGFVGLSGWGGGLSEAVAVSVDSCYPLPESIDLRLVALIEPLAVARHAVRASDVKDFAKVNVLVLGGGPIGQGVVMDLKAQRVGQVIVSEPTEMRRKQIGKLADQVIDSKTEDVPARCLELTGGKGVDVVFDCAGVVPAMTAGFSALAVRGVYVNVAGWEVPVGLVPLLSSFKTKSCSSPFPWCHG